MCNDIQYLFLIVFPSKHECVVLCICPLTSHPKCQKNVHEIMNIYTYETLPWSGAYTGYH